MAETVFDDVVSNDDLPSGGHSGSQNRTRPVQVAIKQQKQKRSCDICRRRKIRCDGPNMPDGCCSHCSDFGLVCTYVQPQRKRGPKNITIEELSKENASLKAENTSLKVKLLSLSLCSLCSRPLQSLSAQANSSSVFHRSTPESATTPPSPESPEEPPDEQDFTGDDLAERFGSFSIDSLKTKHFGSASTFALANNTLAMKENFLGRPLLIQSRRPLYWDVLPWEKEASNQGSDHVLKFPATDLIAALLDLYFTNVHPTIPILHRPSFERSVAEDLHWRDVEFGALVLSVLAIASRYSHDPRVFLDGEGSLSAGWKFAKQVLTIRQLSEPTIHKVQMYLLLTLYALGTSVPQLSWLFLGVGIRCLQQHGEFRRKPGAHKPAPEEEVWKRAFWSYVVLDRTNCVFLGRPMGLQVEDYDVDFPLEVDDEYWDWGFTQPLGKPSRMSYLVLHVRLCEILGGAMRRLYSSKKAKILMGWDGPEWEQHAVAELDSAMNDYVDSIPPHLRWDPQNLPQGTFFDQSAILHITYNHILIVIHRPYIQKMNAQKAPSLSICARAARAIIHTANTWFCKLQRVPLPSLTHPVFLSGVVLVLYALGTRRAGLSLDNKDLELVRVAMDILKFSESRLQPCGRLWELLRDLCSLDGAAPEIISSESTNILGSSPSNILDAQHLDLWNSTLAPNHSPVLKPGMSIEQLLADADPLASTDFTLDDELMSMWMAAPTDVAEIGTWDAYIENINISSVDMVPNGFRA